MGPGRVGEITIISEIRPRLVADDPRRRTGVGEGIGIRRLIRRPILPGEARRTFNVNRLGTGCHPQHDTQKKLIRALRAFH